MEEITSELNTSAAGSLPWGKISSLFLITALLIAGTLFAYQALVPEQAGPDPVTTGPTSIKTIKRITAAELEERHGLRVHLIGVIADGGIIDFRLKVTDPDKAKRLLVDPANLPEIIVAESGYRLLSPEGLDDDIEFKEGGILFSFYPNDKGRVQSGTPVIVQFGDEQLEPQLAQ